MSDVLTDLVAAEYAAIEIEQALEKQLLAEAMTDARHAYIKDLSKAQQKVALLRLEIGDRWPQPDVMDSYVFLVSEIGEVGDALLRSNHGHRGDYVRNHEKEAFLEGELGDVFLMFCTLATCLGIDLDVALQGCIDKLRSKHVPA
jgi:NTP pyrophosphatase (non-canonical NTP hydrolase)